MRRPAIMIPLLYSRVGMGPSGSSKEGTCGGRGGKLYNFASLSMDEELTEDEDESSLLSLLEYLELMIGAAFDVGSSRAGSKGGASRVILRSANWHSSEQ